MGKQAYDAGRLNGFRFDPDTLVIIGFDTKDGPEHELWDERASKPFSEEMVLSLMNIGCLETITVRKGPNGDPEVVNGRGRTIAGREANRRLKKLGKTETLVTIPAMSIKGDENLMFQVLVSTNEIREPDDLLVKVAKLQRMLARNPDKAQAAITFGVTKTTISNWLKINELPVEVKKAVSSGAIAASTAAKLHGMPKEEQLAEIHKVTETSKATGKKVPTRNVTGKTEPVKRPTAKNLIKMVETLKPLVKEDPFAAGVRAGFEVALGKNRKDVQSLLKAATEAE